jgi:phosphoribosylanthranilate isomerase
MYGGTGVTADWSAAAALARRVPVMLAGGLTPDNVAVAIASVSPRGVDVAGGVEESPGRKSHEKIRRFIEAARKAALQADDEEKESR